MKHNIISPFATNPGEIAEEFIKFPEFYRDATDFALAFNLKIDGANQRRASFVTDDGIPAGMLWMARHYGKSGSDEYFKYTSPLVQKQKSSARSSNVERDSNKITGLITALKKNDEVPTTDRIMAKLKAGMRYAFESVRQVNSKRIAFSVTDEQALALVKFMLTDDQFSAEAHRAELQDKYDKYAAEVAALEETRKELHRFKAPCYAVGIVNQPLQTPGTPANKSYYLVTEATYSPSAAFGSPVNVTLLAPIKRYNSMAESPLAVEAAMIRTYAESRWKDFLDDNEFCLPMRDDYIADLDIAIGYANRGPLWVVIPKVGV